MDRQAHPFGDVAGADVAEIAGRHRKRNFLIVAFGYRQPALEVVDDLGRYPRPVDRVDRADGIAGFELGVVADRLDQVLAVIEHAPHRDIENVGVLQREHLRGLEPAHLLVRREHEHPDAALAAHGIFGAGAGVAGSRAEDVEMAAGLEQGVFKQMAEQLQGDVLERQGRAVRQAQQPDAIKQWRDRGDRLGAESRHRVGVIHQRAQIGGGNVVGEFLQDGERQFRVGQATPARQLGGRDGRIGLWNGQTAIGRQAAQQDVGKGGGGHAAPGADVAHEEILGSREGQGVAGMVAIVPFRVAKDADPTAKPMARRRPTRQAVVARFPWPRG